jgi:hypothetical protein
MFLGQVIAFTTLLGQKNKQVGSGTDHGLGRFSAVGVRQLNLTLYPPLSTRVNCTPG